MGIGRFCAPAVVNTEFPQTELIDGQSRLEEGLVGPAVPSEPMGSRKKIIVFSHEATAEGILFLWPPPYSWPLKWPWLNPVGHKAEPK